MYLINDLMKLLLEWSSEIILKVKTTKTRVVDVSIAQNKEKAMVFYVLIMLSY